MTSQPSIQLPVTSAGLLLKKLVNADSKEEIQRIVKRGFNSDFIDPVYHPLSEYIEQHLSKYGEVPGEDLLRNQHPQLAAIIQDVPIPKASVDALFDAVVSDSAREAIHEYAVDLFKEFQTERPGQELLSFMDLTLAQMRKKYSLTQDRSHLFSEMAQPLWDDYIEAQNPVRRGIPIPIYHIGNSIGSFEPAQVTTVAAKSGVGKTFMLQLCGDAAIHGDPYRYYLPPSETPWTEEMRLDASAKVLMVSFEMSPLDLARRQAAIASKISFSRIRSGKLEKEEAKRYAEFLRALASDGDADSTAIGQRLRILGPESVSTPMQIDAQAEDFNADLVILDGFYLMDGPGEKRWEAVQSNMQQIRLNSLRSNRHYLLATQVDTKSSTKGSSNLDNLSFSASIVHDSNNIIYMHQTPDQKRNHQVDFSMGKVRDGQIMDPCEYQWDWVNMNLAEIGFTASEHDTINQPKSTYSI